MERIDSMLESRRKGSAGGFSTFLSAHIASLIVWVDLGAIGSLWSMLNRVGTPSVYFLKDHNNCFGENVLDLGKGFRRLSQWEMIIVWTRVIVTQTGRSGQIKAVFEGRITRIWWLFGCGAWERGMVRNDFQASGLSNWVDRSAIYYDDEN